MDDFHSSAIAMRVIFYREISDRIGLFPYICPQIAVLQESGTACLGIASNL